MQHIPCENGVLTKSHAILFHGKTILSLNLWTTLEWEARKSGYGVNYT